jgi:flagellar hook protein FlgE
MLVGFTGIKSNQFAIDTIGDNVANVNTTAFKNQRALFETMLYRTLAHGTAPDENQGGTNPVQIGYGSKLAAIQRNFSQGSLERTGMPSDLAINGEGSFILSSPGGEQVYTRDGSFGLNAENVLVANDGSFVQGFAADATGTIVAATLTDLTIPLGTTTPAVATTSASFDGNLDSATTVASEASVAISDALSTAAGPATAATALTDLVDAAGDQLFAAGDVVTISGVEKGGITLPDVSLTVGTDLTTLGDFATSLEEALRINTDPATGGSPGVAVGDGTTAPAGALVITSNLGEVNAISLNAADIRNTTSGALPFAFTSTPAVGDGVTTAFQAHDSLGNPIDVRLRMALESKDDTGTVWRFYVESDDDTSGGAVGSGTVSFDPLGRFVAASGADVSIELAGTGAVTPLTFTLDLAELTGVAGFDGESTLVMSTQDGRPAGRLIEYGVDAEGVITGTFDTGRTQVFGQVALATFTNPEGLIGLSDNNFTVGANSGDAVVVAPQTLGAGRIESGSLEASNVDLSREFIGLITASMGFSAAGRVVRTADEMLQELLLLVR